VTSFLPSHLPALRQELAPSGYPSPENDPIRREPLPINPRYLITSLRQFRLRAISLFLRGFIIFLGLGLSLFIPLIDDSIVGIRAGIFVPMEGRLCGCIELPDSSDASNDPPGSVDVVLGMASGSVDEGRSEGGVFSEMERAATHGSVEGNNKRRF